jgi:hypothetical protein
MTAVIGRTANRAIVVNLGESGPAGPTAPSLPRPLPQFPPPGRLAGDPAATSPVVPSSPEPSTRPAH